MCTHFSSTHFLLILSDCVKKFFLLIKFFWQGDQTLCSRCVWGLYFPSTCSSLWFSQIWVICISFILSSIKHSYVFHYHNKLLWISKKHLLFFFFFSAKISKILYVLLFFFFFFFSLMGFSFVLSTKPFMMKLFIISTTYFLHLCWNLFSFS